MYGFACNEGKESIYDQYGQRGIDQVNKDHDSVTYIAAGSRKKLVKVHGGKQGKLHDGCVIVNCHEYK